MNLDSFDNYITFAGIDDLLYLSKYIRELGSEYVITKELLKSLEGLDALGINLDEITDSELLIKILDEVAYTIDAETMSRYYIPNELDYTNAEIEKLQLEHPPYVSPLYESLPADIEAEEFNKAFVKLAVQESKRIRSLDTELDEYEANLPYHTSGLVLTYLLNIQFEQNAKINEQIKKYYLDLPDNYEATETPLSRSRINTLFQEVIRRILPSTFIDYVTRLTDLHPELIRTLLLNSSELTSEEQKALESLLRNIYNDKELFALQYEMLSKLYLEMDSIGIDIPELYEFSGYKSGEELTSSLDEILYEALDDLALIAPRFIGDSFDPDRVYTASELLLESRKNIGNAEGNRIIEDLLSAKRLINETFREISPLLTDYMANNDSLNKRQAASYKGVSVFYLTADQNYYEVNYSPILLRNTTDSKRLLLHEAAHSLQIDLANKLDAPGEMRPDIAEGLATLLESSYLDEGFKEININIDDLNFPEYASSMQDYLLQMRQYSLAKLCYEINVLIYESSLKGRGASEVYDRVNDLINNHYNRIKSDYNFDLGAIEGPQELFGDGLFSGMYYIEDDRIYTDQSASDEEENEEEEATEGVEIPKGWLDNKDYRITYVYATAQAILNNELELEELEAMIFGFDAIDPNVAKGYLEKIGIDTNAI